MPNPYDEIFDHLNEEEKSPDKQPPFSLSEFEKEEQLNLNEKEPLDEILDNIQHFQNEAETFSQLLTNTRAIDHKVSSKLTRLFLVEFNSDEKKSLKEVREYHKLLQRKFEIIIVPMKSLAQIHLEIVKQFNRDIDKDYHSVEKTDHNVKLDLSVAVKGLNMQRKILAVAANDLELLTDALIDTEQRIKDYIDAGGINNISSAEFEIITQKRSTLTSGLSHQFDYSFFDINMLDKAVISFGIYMKETSSQYLGKLMNVFVINKAT